MFYRDPMCVFVASDAGQAAAVVNWLEQQDVPARMMDTMTMGGLEGLTGWVGVSARGIEVWVLRQADAERAKALVAEHHQAITALLERKASAGPVFADCEECGHRSVFAGDQRGTVQNCPHCGRYLDVPDGDAPEEDGVEDVIAAPPEDADAESTATSAMPVGLSRLRSFQKPLILLILLLPALYLYLLLLSGAAALIRAIFR